MKTFLRVLLGVSLALLSALLVTFSFSPYNLSFLILVSFVPMIISQYKVLPEKVSSLAPAITVGGFLGFYLSSVFAPFNVWYMKLLPLIIGFITFFTDKSKVEANTRTNFRWFVLDGVFSWVGIEFIRSLIPIFGTWAFLSYSFYNMPWFIQPVKIFSIFGLSILIMFINYSIGLLIVKSDINKKKVLAWITITLIIWVSLSLVLYKDYSSKTVKVGVVQANPQGIAETKSDYFRAKLTETLLSLSYEASNRGARIVLWPEGALDYDPKVSNTQLFKDFTKMSNAYLVIPYIVFEENGIRNEVTILSPDGVFLGVFGKDHPVVFLGETSLTRGKYPVFDTEFGKLGVVICYDLDFTDTVRKVVNNGARIILAPSGDWSQIALKHYTHSVFRAVENSVSIVKAEWAYDSVFIDPIGRILGGSISKDPKEAVLVCDVPLSESATFYSKSGDFIGVLSLILMILVQIFLSLRKRKELK